MRIIIEKQQLFKRFAIIVLSMNWIPFRYLISLLPALSVAVSFSFSGFATWFAVFFVFGVIPIIELLVGQGGAFGKDDTDQQISNHKLYDLVIYAVIPVHLIFVYWYLHIVKLPPEVSYSDFFGRAFAMGILCGTFGINVAHELGHRTSKIPQFLSKLLLLTSFYMHFFIEHNRGHHKYVGTPEDPSTGRVNEPVYFLLDSLDGFCMDFGVEARI